MATAIPQDMVTLFESVVKAANESAAQYRSLVGSKTDAVTEVLNTSDDERIVQYREWRDKVRAQIEQAQAKLDEQTKAITEYAESLATEGQDVNPDEVKARYLENRSKATKTRNLLAELFGKEAVDALGIEEVTNLRGTSSTGGATGIKRPRLVSATVNGETVEKDGKTSFTLLTQHINKEHGKIEGSDLRAAAFKAAGTEDLSSLDEGTEVTFTLTVNSSVGDKTTTKDVTVSFVPKVTSGDDEKSEDENKSEDEAA